MKNREVLYSYKEDREFYVDGTPFEIKCCNDCVNKYTAQCEWCAHLFSSIDSVVYDNFVPIKGLGN